MTTTKLFGNAKKSTFKKIQKVIEELLISIGMDPNNCEVPTGDESKSWTLMRQEKMILITLSPNTTDEENNNIKIIVNIIDELTEGPKEKLIYKYLLEANARDLENAAFGLLDQSLVVISEKKLQDIELDELKEMIDKCVRYAKKFEENIYKKFEVEDKIDSI